jgi:Gpi18-like mannosyltransferase
MKLDIIYLIVFTPVVFAVSYAYWCMKQYRKQLSSMPEAKPYEFEKDQFIEGFNEKIKHQRSQIKRMYKGKIN